MRPFPLPLLPERVIWCGLSVQQVQVFPEVHLPSPFLLHRVRLLLLQRMEVGFGMSFAIPEIQDMALPVGQAVPEM